MVKHPGQCSIEHIIWNRSTLQSSEEETCLVEKYLTYSMSSSTQPVISKASRNIYVIVQIVKKVEFLVWFIFKFLVLQLDKLFYRITTNVAHAISRVTSKNKVCVLSNVLRILHCKFLESAVGPLAESFATIPRVHSCFTVCVCLGKSIRVSRGDLLNKLFSGLKVDLHEQVWAK